MLPLPVGLPLLQAGTSAGQAHLPDRHILTAADSKREVRLTADLPLDACPVFAFRIRAHTGDCRRQGNICRRYPSLLTPRMEMPLCRL